MIIFAAASDKVLCIPGPHGVLRGRSGFRREPTALVLHAVHSAEECAPAPLALHCWNGPVVHVSVHVCGVCV